MREDAVPHAHAADLDRGALIVHLAVAERERRRIDVELAGREGRGDVLQQPAVVGAQNRHVAQSASQ